MRDPWMMWLPRDMDKLSQYVDCAAFAAVCRCGLNTTHSWAFPAPCPGLVEAIMPMLVEETAWALDAWAEYRGRRMPEAPSDAVVIHSRCAGDTWISHPSYGPVAFSFYDTIPASGVLAPVHSMCRFHSRRSDFDHHRDRN